MKEAENKQQAIVSSDLISRKAAIKSMANAIWHYPNELYTSLNSYEMSEALAKDGLMFLPSAELKPEWIPCSERLPKVGVNVLVCDIDNDIYLTHMSPYKSFYDEFCDYIKNVKAWMPLPTPYQPKEDES